ncbi:MAG: hypothetical protein Kow0074_20160 [Candidatus Zixiibacteriota bacterium]
MPDFYEISGQSESAVVNVSLEFIREQLKSDGQWAANVLAAADRSGARVAYAKAYGSVLGATFIEDTPDCILVRGASGKNTRLMYRVERIDDQSSRVLPEGKVEGPAKIVIPLALLFFCIIPVLLTPLVYKARASSMRRFSAKYLEAFCLYLGGHRG